jgi:hypothetical protein
MTRSGHGEIVAACRWSDMRRVRRIAVLMFLVSMVGLAPASASDVPVAATILPGGRTLTSVSLGTLASVVRGASTSATLTAVVTETAVDGLDPWSVTVRLCGPNNVTTPTASDCATYPDQLVKAADATKTVPGSAVSISGRTVNAVLGGGTSTATAGTQALSATRTMFTNTGQVPSTLYSGVYTSTATVALDAPSNSTAGVYNGFLVVTLLG